MHAEAQRDVELHLAELNEDVLLAIEADVVGHAIVLPCGEHRIGRCDRRRLWQTDLREIQRDVALLRLAQGFGLRQREQLKMHLIAGMKLTELPHLALGEGHGADEAAEARAVGA